ncbi:scoloptoxin SSD976-like [Diabrotica virgifera virgifera]|uniref:Venom allergen 5.01-like n=1 Tax=Diabrotica virgifera virgifera TaxID=50390 RepID=A0A6P7GB17_DIAVI|nr:scoloptoxin SSD976-like [Diabrotica virgifera virgifera]
MILYIKLTVLIILTISNITYSMLEDYDSLSECKEEWPSCEDQINVMCDSRRCRPPVNRDCRPMEMDDELRNHILKEHNRLRNFLASGEETRGGVVGASNMMVLNYDYDLERSAACTATKCDMYRDRCRRTKRFERVGQNHHRAPTEQSQMQAANTWYLEIIRPALINYPAIFDDWKPFHTVSNFTQVVWAKTTHVGCGRSVSEEAYFLVCSYGPGGNRLSQPVYKKGEPATQCPPKVKRSKKYPNLCGTAHDINVAVHLHPIQNIWLYIFFTFYSFLQF